MTRITAELLRKRAEHNNMEIFSLEEVSLHQQDIEKIELIEQLCKNLRILYLQNNLIGRIENVGKLKELRYLNLALNNVLRIENLEGCEFLEKLDLTVNFVADVLSVESLACNRHLRELFLTGNPCTKFEGYRDYVIASLPSLQSLDGLHIEKSARIQATQNLPKLRRQMQELVAAYEAEQEAGRRKKEEEKAAKEKRQQEKRPGFDGNWYTDPNAHLATPTASADPATTASKSAVPKGIEEDADESDKEDWNELTEHNPETRTQVHKKLAEKRAKAENRDPAPPKRERVYFLNGRPLNMNEGQWDYTLTGYEASDPNVVLDLACYKYLDTSLIDVDVQPAYIRVTMKEKVLQLTLPEDVSPDSSNAKRSEITGRLLVTMPKARPIVTKSRGTGKKASATASAQPERELLEVRDVAPPVQLSGIVGATDTKPPPVGITRATEPRKNDEHFVDDADVPPLE
eukprot:m.138445 g.138445  ORF g.138445 m.138445 type:complete len:460 (+) comp52529_c0_seq4:105-1484(+)